MIARSAASVVLAAGLVLGASGCSFFAPQASLIHYEPSDGTAATIGEIKARNVVAISDDGTTANLVFGLINSGTKTEYVYVQYTDASGAKKNNTLKALPAATTPVGYDGGSSITMYNVDAPVGGLVPVYLRVGNEQGKLMMVPVLDGTQPQFSTLVPAAN